MPRYHFGSVNGERDRDLEGFELADDRAAQLTAIGYAGDMLKAEPTALRDNAQWRVEVTDDVGTLIFIVIATTIDVSQSANPHAAT